MLKFAVKLPVNPYPCGSWLASDEGIRHGIIVTDKSLSRTSPLPQGPVIESELLGWIRKNFLKVISPARDFSRAGQLPTLRHFSNLKVPVMTTLHRQRSPRLLKNLLAAALLLPALAFAQERPWPDGSQLVISVSMQFETGGQPEGAESPFSGSPLPKGYPDLPAQTWFDYGYKEGLWRMLDLWDRTGIKVTSHVVGEAALKHPELAKAIAERGHELAAHGMRWADSYNMSYEQEKHFIGDGVAAVEKLTGQRSVGYNANWLRRSPNTLKVLQDLNFTYHIDDVSRDEPFVTMVRGRKFAVVPYTLRNNDIVLVEGRHFSADQFYQQLVLEFDRLYAEGANKRRMMSVSLHDRIGGTPAMAEAMERFIRYAQSHPKVSFMRKDKIAQIVLTEKNPLIDNSEALYNN